MRCTCWSQQHCTSALTGLVGHVLCRSFLFVIFPHISLIFRVCLCSGSSPIFRLGETYSMSRIRRPPGNLSQTSASITQYGCLQSIFNTHWILVPQEWLCLRCETVPSSRTSPVSSLCRSLESLCAPSTSTQTQTGWRPPRTATSFNSSPSWSTTDDAS